MQSNAVLIATAFEEIAMHELKGLSENLLRIHWKNPLCQPLLSVEKGTAGYLCILGLNKTVILPTIRSNNPSSQWCNCRTFNPSMT